MSKKFGGVDLKTKKKFIKKTITEIIDAMQPDEEEQSDGELRESVHLVASLPSHPYACCYFREFRRGTGQAQGRARWVDGREGN